MAVILTMMALPVRAQPLPQQVNALWQAFQHIPADNSAAAIELLFRLRSCYRYLQQPEAEDSVSAIMEQRVRGQGDDALAMATLFRWFASLDELGIDLQPFRDTPKVAGYVTAMQRIAQSGAFPAWRSQAWYAAARYAAARGDFRQAGADMRRALAEAGRAGDDELMIRCLLLTGYCEEQQLRKLEGFRHYADALYLSRKIHSPRYQIYCYLQFFECYFDLGNYDRAEEYIYKSIPFILQLQPADSVLLMNQISNLAFLRCSDKDYGNGLRMARWVLDYAFRNGNEYLKWPVFATVKGTLMEHGEYGRLKDFYFRYYPDELSGLARKEPEVYYQLKAAFGEADGLTDTAHKYYRLSSHEIFSTPHSANIRTFYLRRYGHFLLRSGMLAEARPVLDSALHYAEAIRYLPYMTELSSQLDSIAAWNGDLKEAYHYAKRNKRYSDALSAANRQDEILMLDLENELRGRELLAEQEAIRTHHRHNVQYMAITLLIGVCFLILMLLGSFKVPHWAITAMGFFSFIFFFEFIILLIDHQVHAMTHGEPWKILVIKIVIIAGLLPLHHWLEHQVVHYLHTHQMIDPKRLSLRPIIRRLRLAFRPPAPPKQPASPVVASGALKAPASSPEKEAEP